MALDRIITIEQPVISRDAYGAEVTSWATLAEVWANKIPAKGKERFIPGANIKVATRAATWRIR